MTLKVFSGSELSVFCALKTLFSSCKKSIVDITLISYNVGWWTFQSEKKKIFLQNSNT